MIVALPGLFSYLFSIRFYLFPLLFLIYINDTVVDTHYSIRLFADDASLYIIVDASGSPN